MSYKRFKIADFYSTPATIATVATLSPFGAQTVANVASVATGEPETAFSAAALSWDDDLQAAFEERVAVLVYDGGWPRAEAERAALAIVRARLMDDPGLVPAAPGGWACIVCGGPDHPRHALVPVLSSTQGAHLWLHRGTCHAEHLRRLGEAAGSVLRAAGLIL